MNSGLSLALSQLTCSRGGRQLFQAVSCELGAGQWLYVGGVNGAGKTSLLRIVCGLSPPDSGSVLYNNTPIALQKERYWQDLCYLGHHNALQESLSVEENLRFAMALSGRRLTTEALQDALSRMGLAGRAKQLVRHLSQGQKRRVALTRLALSQARLWVLDEPYVAMDDSGIQTLARLIDDHLASGAMAVITSHQRVDIGARAARHLELHAAA